MQRQLGSKPFEGVAFLVCMVLALLSLTGVGFAQGSVPGGYQIGFPEQGEFNGSGFENVQMNNNNLHIEVPLWELPGRGPATGYKYVYDSKGWAYNETCNQRTGTCTNTVSPHPLGHGMGCCDQNNLQFPLVSSFDFGGATVRATANCNAGNVLVYSFYLNTPEGTHHHFVPDPVGPTTTCPNSWTYVTTVYADDGSGWIMHVDPSTGNVLAAVEKNGTGNVLSGIEDANGNQILLGSPITDTLGRQIPSATSYYDSNGVLRNVQVTSENVAIQTNLCKFQSDDFCHEYSGSFYMPQVITLPNGMSYTFTYDQGSPTHPYYGQPLSVTLPTGGQITWGWSVEEQNGPILVTRQLSGDPAPWKYSHVGYPITTDISTDPAGNDTVYTCGDYGTYNEGGDPPPCYIIKKQYYQGSSTSGTLIKTIQTDYQLTNNLPILPIRETTTWNQQNLVSQTETDYDSWPIPGWTGFSASASNPVEKREFDYGTGSRGVQVRTTDYGYLHLSNSTYLGLNIADKVTSKKVWAGPSGTGTLVAQTLNTYDGVAISGNTSSNPAPNHDYTNFPASYNYRGNLTQVSKGLKSGSTWTWLNTNNTYNDLGEVLTSKDPIGNQTSYDYTDSWASITNSQCVTSAHSYGFATTITDALSHQTKHTFYSCTSLTGSTQDANDIAASRPGTTFSYDLIDRATAVNYPDGGQTTFSYNDAVPYTKTSTQLIRTSPTTLNKVSAVVHDGLGRVQQTQLVDPDCSSGPVKADYTYSYDPSPPAGIPAGRFTTVSNPYCTTSDSTYGITKTRYDALDRPVLLVPPDGTDTANNVSTVYAGNVSTVTDQAGAARKNQTDGLGRLTFVYEDPANANYETDYSYDVLDDLIGVTQKGGSTSTNWRTRSFQYDSLARLTQSTNPESGTVNYSYNANSDLFQKVSPQANQQGSATTTITYCYDADNRLASKTYSAQTCPVASPAVKYLYDQSSYNGLTITNGIGQRTGMSDGSGTTAWSFDPMGRAAAEKRTLNSNVAKSLTFYYYPDGEMQQAVWPTTHQVTYTPNAAGRSVSAVGSTFNFVTSATYLPQGAIHSAVVGNASGFNGITIADTYNKRLQPSAITATLPSSTLVQSLTYNFNVGTSDNGNVYSITNGKDATRSQTFTYDNLNRIKTAATQGTTGAHCWGQMFGHMNGSTFVPGIDPWGNLIEITGTQCSSPTLSQGVTTKNQFLAPMVYDAAGNLTNDGGGHAYNYDQENRLNSAGGMAYIYDGDGKRVEKCTTGSTPGTCSSTPTGTLYWTGPGWDPLLETDLSGNATAEYVFFNGGRVARVDMPANSVEYYFSDHLKSTDIVTNATGAIVRETDYVPYGGEVLISGTDTNHYKFTGKERDPESGLDDFDARFYSSSFGRFMTPDWEAKPTNVPYANFGNPQSLNLYSYVQNNPTTMGDPDGHVPNPGDDAIFVPEGGGLGVSGGIGQPASSTVVTKKQNQSDPTAPPPPPTPDPAGTRTDPALNPTSSTPSTSTPSTTSSPTGQTQAPMESRSHGKGEQGQTSKPDKPTKGVQPVKDQNGKVIGYSIPSQDGKRTPKTLEWGRANGLNPKDFETAKKVGFWAGVAAAGTAALRALGPFLEGGVE
jgi:RHS repeat-associated protein